MDGLAQGRDQGAALAVILDGQPVVDVWAGFRDRRGQQSWQRDTLCCAFSMTKAVTATCVLQAVAAGLLELDCPVADYWPEFAENSKQAITVRQLFSHQSGVIGFHTPVDRDILYDWAATTTRLAAESPWWEPGKQHGYHARTFGYLLGELLLRVSGRSVGQWFNEEFAEPLSLDFHIGLNDEDMQRCADIVPARIRAGAQAPKSAATQQMMAAMRDISTPTGAAFQNPSLGPGYMNSQRFRAAEMPAANGHGTALSLATFLAGIDNHLPAELLQEATTTHSLGPDVVLKSVSHFGLGFMLHHEHSPIGLREGSFGHAGAGGSMVFYDPALRLGYCFVMNQLQEGVVSGGTSATRIAESIYECL